MIPSDHFSVADKENLYHRVPVITGECQNIPVLAVRVGDLLLLGDLSDTVQEIPVLDRFLEIQFLRRGIHLFLQHAQNRLIPAIQKVQHAIDLLSVLLL